MESVDRTRLSRAPHTKYKFLLPNGVRSMGRALECFRRVAKQTDNALVRAVATGREFVCESIRVLYVPYAASGKWLPTPGIRPEGLTCALGVLRELSRMAKDAARVETPSFRAFDVRHGYLTKYSLSAAKASTVVAPSAQLSTPSGPTIQAPTPKRSRSPARTQKAEPRFPFSDRSPKGENRAREAGSGRRRSRSRPRGEKSVHADTVPVLLRGAPVKTMLGRWRTNAVHAT